jgi:MarR family transcriptional regulator, lower aerobic nicotinate degradation pathway regulator
MKTSTDTQSKSENQLPYKLLAYLPYLVSSLQKESRSHFDAGSDGFLFPHFSIASSLEEFGPSSQQGLCARLGYDKSDLAKTIDSLEKKGVIQRRADSNDKRKYFVTLSPQGKKLLRQKENELQALSEKIFGNLNVKEKERLADLLRKALVRHDSKFRLTPEDRV